jgi:hypothetical protein
MNTLSTQQKRSTRTGFCKCRLQFCHIQVSIAVQVEFIMEDMPEL